MKRYRLILWLIVLMASITGCDRGARPALVGRPAPTFAVEDTQHRVALADFRGKVVILNFWATWCPPCIEEMPSLVAMQTKLIGKVTVLAVSTDENDDAYQRFITTRGIVPTLLTVRDAAQQSNTLYGTFKFPETYIIDRNGVLRRKFIGPVDWTAPEIEEYLLKL